MTGVACCLAQVGSLDISMGFHLRGVPGVVDLPVTVPPPAGGLGVANMTIEVQAMAARAAAEKCVSRILLFLLTTLGYWAPAAESGPIGLMSLPWLAT